MYSVIRFSDREGDDNYLMVLGERINELMPGTFEGLDRVPHQFSCSISVRDNWDEHAAEIVSSVETLSPVIADAREQGIGIEIDTQIGIEDYESEPISVFILRPKMMKALWEQGILFLFSVY